MGWNRSGKEREEFLLGLWSAVKVGESLAIPAIHGAKACGFASVLSYIGYRCGLGGFLWVLSLSFLISMALALVWWVIMRAAITDSLWMFVDEVYSDAGAGLIDVTKIPVNPPDADGLKEQVVLISERAKSGEDVKIRIWDFWAC